MVSRRSVLAVLSTATAGSLAGCAVLGNVGSATPTPVEYTALDDETVYVDPVLSLSVPDGVATSDSPGDATVMVVPGDTDRSASAIVHWLARDAAVAFVGTEAQSTWHDVRDSGAYEAMLGEHQARATSCANSESSSSGSSSGGASDNANEGTTPTDCEPPDVLVAMSHPELPSTTYRKTWAATDDPSDRQVFGAIETALGGE